jgi:hypothetical protein
MKTYIKIGIHHRQKKERFNCSICWDLATAGNVSQNELLAEVISTLETVALSISKKKKRQMLG